jgi:SET domain
MFVTNKAANTIEENLTEIRVNNETGFRSLFSNIIFYERDVISNFSWKKIFKIPSYLTVEIAENEHILLEPTFLECINHSCSPNAYFDTTLKQLVCLREIGINEEITFFYPSTEWEMDKPFECYCGSKDCIGIVSGAKYLKTNTIKNYRFTDYINLKIACHFENEFITK